MTYKESVSNHHVYPLGCDDSFGMRIKAGMWMVDRRVVGDFGNREVLLGGKKTRGMCGPAC